MKTPPSLQTNATALFSRERRRQRLAAFIAVFDRTLPVAIPGPIPPFVTAKAPTQVVASSRKS